MGKKPGRNDRCPCGSGKKYKKCHLDKDEPRPMNPHELLNEIRKITRRPCCMHPGADRECKGSIVNAHTVQRAHLTTIARDGHVYQCIRDIGSKPGPLEATHIGINEASTVKAFCEYHDHSAFKPIDTLNFIATPEQCHLHAYRALAMEYYKAMLGVPALDKLIENANNEYDSVRHLTDSPLLHILHERQHERQLEELYSIKNHFVRSKHVLGLHKSSFEGMLPPQDTRLKYYCVFFPEPPELLCSTAVPTECDFTGNFTLEDPYNRPSDEDIVCFSLFPTNAGGAALFAWIDERHGVCTRFIHSFSKLPDSDKGNALVRFVFEFSANQFCAPDWWEELSSEKRDHLLHAADTGGHDQPRSNALIDDGLKYVSWTVSPDVKTNVAL